MTIRSTAIFLFCALSSAWSGIFDFPTENHSLLNGRKEDFYMYVERDFEGQKSRPWEGGQFGFVRGPQRIQGKVVLTTLHEGVDIRPLHRDATGNPLDEVLAAANGIVVHANNAAGASNYGRYIVLEHRLEGCPFYTLYAHLNAIAVPVGKMVKQGEKIGCLGYTGAGIDRPRAHLHFEIAMILSRQFEGWYKTYFPGTPNRHGIFNGLNLIGTDPAPVLIASAQNPHFSLSTHIAAQEPFYKITIPRSPHFSLLRDYPWLVPQGEDTNPPAWTLFFTQHGLPVRVVACGTPIKEARLEWVKETNISYARATRGIVGGPPGQPRLTEAGQRFARLLTWPNE